MSKRAADGETLEPQFAPGARVAVQPATPTPTPYDYVVPDHLTLSLGDIVEVPLRGRMVPGVVLGPGECDLSDTVLKRVRRRCDAPPLPAADLRFAAWVAAYTVHSLGAVLKMALSVPDALDPPPPAAVCAPADHPAPWRETAARRRVLDVLAASGPQPAPALARAAAVSPGVVAGLLDAGVLVAAPAAPAAAPPPLRFDRGGPPLSADQTAAAAALAGAVGGGFSVALLDGVPGSGKTEVYFEAIAETLRRGLQSLVLLPEIALGAQWLVRFEARFGAPPTVWHSDLSRSERRRAWRAAAEGRAPVVVGARSALFLPLPALGLVVVDEEHDASFKQEDGVAYNARDMAVVRGRISGAPVILASATPSLETLRNVARGRYRGIELPDRYGGAREPRAAVVDLRRSAPARGLFIADPTRRAIAEAIERGEQALLFLNRRGYAPLTLCRGCGHRLTCPNCAAWLVEHRALGRLLCHHCGHGARIPERCPACAAEGALSAVGPGVERLAEEAAAAFPSARIELATSDTITGPDAAAALVRRMEAGEIDIVIGTQIIAKGYHFPRLTLAVAVDADLGLDGGDLRAAERTFQLLYQVAGRAGRAERPGRVLIQTTAPSHPVIAALASGDRAAFLAAEDESRRAAGMPPYGRLAALIVSSRDEAAVDDATRALAVAAPRVDRVRIWGPAPAPLALLRGRHRRRFLVHGPRAVALSPLLRAWLATAALPRSVRVQVDVDPMSFV